jgi:peroxiredoxin
VLGVVLALVCVIRPLPGQEPQTLSDLQRRFAEQRDELVRSAGGRVDFEQLRDLAKEHATVLTNWLEKNPDTSDATDARLMLTNIWMDIGDQDKARATLLTLSPDRASPLQLAAGAEMAQFLGEADARERWIDAAVTKDAPRQERMALAMFLMTRLVEVERGEAIFTAAMESAKDDEERAEIAFHRATAISMREDLPDGAYEQSLEELATRYPDTYWGGVAKDRVAALRLEIGSPAIPFEGPTLDGGTLALSDLTGAEPAAHDVVLLDFWNAASVRDGRVPAVLKGLLEEFGDEGFRIVGVSLDEDAELAKRTAARHGMSWPSLFDGRGWRSDAALRYAVESVPYHILIDRDGKIAALRVFLLDDYGQQELRDTIASAVGRRDG